MFHVTKSSITIDKQITITIFVLLLMEILMNNVDHVFCLFVWFFFSFPFLFKFFNTPPKKNIYMLAILYKTLTISMIQLELTVVFLLSQSMYLLTICFMYLTYFLIMHCIYLFIFSLELRCYVYLFISCLLTYLVFSYVI